MRYRLVAHGRIDHGGKIVTPCGSRTPSNIDAWKVDLI